MGLIYYDSFPRSGSHFLISCLNKAFPSNTLVWGRHDIRFLSIPNMTTVVRNPIDSISSLAVMNSEEHNFEYLLTAIKLNLEWLTTTLENFTNINIILFDDLINNTPTTIETIQKHYNLNEIASNDYANILSNLVSDTDVRNAYAPHVQKEMHNKIAKQNLLLNTKDLTDVMAVYQEIKAMVY